MQETRVWSLSWKDLLEKGMATHSSILAWRIPWTEDPSGLQSMGSQRVGHNWSDLVPRTKLCVCFQSCPTLCDPMDCRLPGSCVHGILQARILVWVATSVSKIFVYWTNSKLHSSLWNFKTSVILSLMNCQPITVLLYIKNSRIQWNRTHHCSL